MTRLDPRLRGFATGMRNAPTPPEAVLWSRLRASQLGFKFRRQAVIGPYIVDFFCPAVGLIVELDGRTHDGEADVERDGALAAEGFRVLRFSNSAISADIEQVVRTIYLTARDLPPRFGPHPPAPSPEGEGEQNGLPSPGGEQNGLPSLSGEGSGVGNDGAAEFASPSRTPPGRAARVSRPSAEGERRL